MKLNLVTELEIHTSDGGCVTLDALSENYIVMYNDPAGKGLTSAGEISMGDLYMDLACGEVFSLIITGVEVTEEDGEEITTRDIVLYGSSITSIFATSESVMV